MKKEKQFLQAVLQKSGDRISFVASDETLDRSGEVIPIESWDLTNFMKNPVLLVNHDYMVENIVGMATNIRFEGKSLVFDPVFHGITDLSKEVEQMVNEGVLNTVSVGFLPHGPVQDGDTGRNELLEVSFVAVPANPNAERIKTLLDVKNAELAMQVKTWVEKQEEQDEAELDPAKLDELETTNKILQQEITELKEGRILSGKNRKRIETAVSLLESLAENVKQASEALNELLTATDANADKDAGESREPKVDAAASKSPAEVKSRVRRALQRINKDTNSLLRELKP
ncbi:MAG TPA: hypothetical protein VFX17_02180 [Patescibacteria group bacterium]|nr:hypothetical protein [Patescibacteria group bacterium]